MTAPPVVVLRRDDAMFVIAKFVVVAPVWPIAKIVVEEVFTASKSLPAPHAEIFAYGDVVPNPENPVPLNVTFGVKFAEEPPYPNRMSAPEPSVNIWNCKF